MGITIDPKKIKSKAQVDALEVAGVITAAQAKKLLRGLKPPSTMKAPTEQKPTQAAAKASVAPKADKVPAGYIVLDKTQVDDSFLSATKGQAGARLHAFAKIKSSTEFLYYYLPSDNQALPTKHTALVKAVRDVAAGVVNYMSKQQSLVEAKHTSFPAQIWSPGDVGFHPRELEPRLEKALKKFGVTLAQLPDVLREAALTLQSSEVGTHNPRDRMLNAANEFERRDTSAAYQMAKNYTPVFRVDDREGSWQLKLTAAADGQQKIDIVLRPGTEAPTKTANAPKWIAGKLEKLEYSAFDASLPARFQKGGGTPHPVTTAPVTAPTTGPERRTTGPSPERALLLARSLASITDVNRVPRNVSLSDIQGAAATLRAGALEVAQQVQGTRGNSTGWGGETVNASELNRLADHLELLALQMGGSFPSGALIAPERALQIHHDVAGITDANRVPRHISRKDIEDACGTIQAAASDVQQRVAGTRGSQVGWGGELVSYAGMLKMAGELAALALKMKQAGY